MIFVDICRVTAALVRGCGHHCTVFRSLRSGTPVTANLRKRNMRTDPEQPYSSSVGGVRGARCPCARRLVGKVYLYGLILSGGRTIKYPASLVVAKCAWNYY